MVLLKWLTSFLIIVIGFLSIWIGIGIKECSTLKVQRNSYLIQLDSLKAENVNVISQFKYLMKFYDSTKKRIPEPTGFAFIADSVTNTGK